MATISYAITVSTELDEIKKLIPYLQQKIRHNDEIVVVYDSRNGSKEVLEYLEQAQVDHLHTYQFKGNFANLKNVLTDRCAKEYIFQIDADEIPAEYLIGVLPDILTDNPNIDVIRVPRINIVNGITKKHIQEWNWHQNPQGWINFPDYQWRIYRNAPDRIKWVGKVHERLDGYKEIALLPKDSKDWCLHHEKSINKQEQQNSYYSRLAR